MTKSLILFDLDGTLADTLTDIAGAANFALTQLGQPTHDVPEYRRKVGDGADVLMQRALPSDQQHLADEALMLFKQHYEAHLFDHSKPYAGVTDMLDELVRRDVAIAVLTNKPQNAAEQMVQRLLGEYPWRIVAGHREGIAKKPDAAPALAIAEHCGVDPSACAFVGDSNTDMRTAVNAAMKGVGVTWGFRDRNELTEAGASAIIDQPMQLLDHI